MGQKSYFSQIEGEYNLIMTKKNLWFKRKLYGWGWTPNTWQGWLVIALYLIVVLFLSQNARRASTAEQIFTFFFPLTVVTLIFITITYQKGESPHWQWGPPKKLKP